MSFIIKQSNIQNKGLFTERAFDKDAIVMPMRGNRISREEMQKLANPEKDNVLQIGKDLFLNMAGEREVFINHSCNPNCYVKAVVNSAFLIALRPIEKNEEITYDYSITSTDSPEEWTIKCNCNRFYCRKEISGFNNLLDDKKKEYIDSNLVPRYLRGK